MIPLTGGLGVFIGFLLVQPLLGIPMGAWYPLYLGLLGLMVCGMVDDARVIRNTDKLGIQLTVAAMMVVSGGHVLNYLGTFPLVGEIRLVWWLAMPLTLMAVTGLINAVNMMDGVDGLAGGSALSMLAWLAFVAALQSQLALLAVILTLGAALVGFLLFNLRHPWRRQASVFMGDSGSMALGFAIAWFVVALSQSENALVSPVAYGWLLALPVMDTLSLMVRRYRKGISPFAPDRDHLHHIFLRAGFTPGQTTMILMLVVGALGGIGVMFSLAGVPDVLLLAGLLGLVVVHDIFVRRAWMTSKALRRVHLATLSAAKAHQRQRLSVRLRRRPMVGGKRRQVAVFGAYLLCFSMTLNLSLALAGGTMMLVAALASAPVLWRDLYRLPLFWISLLLSGYVLLRLMLSGALADPYGWAFVSLCGLVSLPLGWWLAQMRVHWAWLVLTLISGGAVAFVLQADWLRFQQGMLTSPWAWGQPGRVGFMASAGLMVVLASLFAGLQRLGTGWRPAYQVALSLVCAVSGVVILVGTGFATAWLATLAGMLCFAVVSPVLGRHQGHRLGRWGMLMLLILGVLGIGSLQMMQGGGSTLSSMFVEPLQAMGMVLRGEVQQAHALHPGMVERLMLWQQAWQAWQADWLFGNGGGRATVANASLAGYNHYHSLLAAVVSGLGVVGVLGFAAVVLIPLNAVVWMALKRAWHSSWALGVLSCGVSVLVMSVLAVPVYYPESLVFILLFMAAVQVAVIQKSWLTTPRHDVPAPFCRIKPLRSPNALAASDHRDKGRKEC
ncbi:MraY family glycosyltransferase [Halomonas ventosae]|uniref:UDP-GlcNAc:undecaprenyl-phosphate GlcNAc-1-phosphate transferase n=1 Tax=Halomonas ventosae TaxID=229007 RepID=A0A4R6I3T1_9GAMM|nr:MraY family glycosyltransferase [Halomonas ventosae]TDO16650.1 UDP-GlcNAc:undecaprenyl-phosphate GlcNAc-1-phosphate transferase [Halomonas ventosae]